MTAICHPFHAESDVGGGVANTSSRGAPADGRAGTGNAEECDGGHRIRSAGTTRTGSDIQLSSTKKSRRKQCGRFSRQTGSWSLAGRRGFERSTPNGLEVYHVKEVPAFRQEGLTQVGRSGIPRCFRCSDSPSSPSTHSSVPSDRFRAFTDTP